MTVALQTAAEYEPPAKKWLVEGLLLDSSLNLVIGKPKAGKTRLTSGIVAALASATNLGGREELAVSRPHDVLWIGTDGGWKAQVQAAVRLNDPNALGRVLWPQGATMAEAGLIYHACAPADETNRNWINLAKESSTHGVDVIVVDHLFGVLGDRGVNEDTAVAPFLNVLNEISAMGITVIVLHHTSEKDFGNRSDVAMGHTLITATARQIISVREKRREIDYQEVFVRGNETREMALQVKPLGAGPLTVTWHGPADDRPSPARRGSSETRKKRDRGDLGPERARYILSGPEAARDNQSKAGLHLEGAPPRIKGDLTNGREGVKMLMKKGLLSADERGRVIPGPSLASISD